MMLNKGNRGGRNSHNSFFSATTIFDVIF